MTPELTALALAGLLQAAQLVVFAIPANRELGPDWTAGPRDTPTGRCRRSPAGSSGRWTTISRR